jgi:hypothetical protein
MSPPLESRVQVGVLFVFFQGPDCLLKMLGHPALGQFPKIPAVSMGRRNTKLEVHLEESQKGKIVRER